MNPHDQFWTEEFFRYSAECRHLARLARKPHAEELPRIDAAVRRSIEWLGEFHEQYVELPRRRLQLVPNRSLRR